MDGPAAEEVEQVLAELEAVELRLRRLQDGLARAHRLATLGTMASIIAHEFNNILTPIISYCQLARRSPGDPKLAAKAIEKSLRGAERAAEISGSMLGFARDAAEPAGAADGGACVGEVVEEVLAMLARSPERDRIRLKVEVPADCRVAMGTVNLQQVVLNLVLNARAAMAGQGGGGVLVIRAAAGGLNTVIEVSDSGPGVPDEVLPRIFEPFVTRRCGPGGANGGVAGEAKGSGEAETPGGTGLGLAICRDLVRRAGGEITIPRSGPSGTTFRVELPTG